MANIAQDLDGNGKPTMGGISPGAGYVTLQMGNNELTDSATGKLYAPAATTPVDGQKASYAAVKIGLVPAASPTDVFTITGSATKTIRITRLEITGNVASTAGTADVVVLMRSTANTGGTTTSSPTLIPYDSTNGPATATVLSYTANPTVGTAVGGGTGAIRARKLFLNIAATGSSDSLTLDFGSRPSQAIVLRGTSQVLAVNLNGASLSGTGALDITVEWTEE